MAQREPTEIFILGGGGDLAQRKLLPALFDLYIQDLLPDTFVIVGLARTERSDEEYRALVEDAIRKQEKNYEATTIAAFLEHIRYVTGSFEELASYRKLADELSSFESKFAQVNRLFYLAVPPAHYERIFTLLSESGLGENRGGAWSRFLIEKPFGNDYAGAVALNTAIGSIYNEDQIFRIDHYLAKEAIQNILSFRFANTLIKNVWSKEHIKRVNIFMHESINVEKRGAFYDTVGALKDVGQNHLLQMLALIAMDEPEVFDAEHIRQKRSEVLEALIPMELRTLPTSVVRGQYEGYRDTPGVKENSEVETYFEFVAFIGNERWSGVPFYIEAGKALKNDEVVVRIDFKEQKNSAFAAEENAITLTISPVQSMNITLNVKKPGHGYHIEQNTLSFAWDEENRGVVNAYEKVLLDCIEGERTLFTKTDEVLASWKFIRSITEVWDQIPLQIYEQGSEGPQNSIDRGAEEKTT